MNSTLGNFLIGLASSFGFALVIKIIQMNWHFIKHMSKSFIIRCETSMEGLELQSGMQRARLSVPQTLTAAILCCSPTTVIPLQDREGIMPSQDLTMEKDLEAANGSMSEEVPLTEVAAVTTNVGDKPDKTDHITDEEIGCPLVKAN